MTLASWVIIGIIIAATITAFIMMVLNKKKYYYKVHLANPDQSELRVYRTSLDKFWSLDAPAFVSFRKENGKRVRINKHWIIKIEAE